MPMAPPPTLNLALQEAGIDKWKETFKNQPLEFILLAICDAAGRQQHEIKLHLKNTRDLSRLERSLTTDAKINVYLRKEAFIAQVWGTSAQIFSPFARSAFNSELLGTVISGFGQAASPYAHHKEQLNHSEITHLDFKAQRVERQEGDYTQGYQEAAKKSDEFYAMVDRVMQSSQRLFESLSAAAA